MEKYSEVFVGMDVSKSRIAVGLADGGGASEARFLGEIEASEASVTKLVRRLSAKHGPARRRSRPFARPCPARTLRAGPKAGGSTLQRSGGDRRERGRSQASRSRDPLRTRACLQLTGERIGIGYGTLCVSDARGIPESANV